MPAGIEIINTSGTILIDSAYSNLALVSSGAVPAGDSVISIPQTNPGEVVAVRATGGAAATFMGEIVRTAGAAVEWFIFGRPQASGNYGFQVYDADGRVTFDSSLKYARVSDIRSFFLNVTESFQVEDASRKYAAVLNRPGFLRNLQSGPFYPFQPAPPYWYEMTDSLCGVEFSGPSVTAKWVPVLYASNLDLPVYEIPSDLGMSDRNCTISIIDVTGY